MENCGELKSFGFILNILIRLYLNFYLIFKKKNYFVFKKKPLYEIQPMHSKKKKKHFSLRILPNFIKLTLKESFCIFPERSTEISVLFHHFQISMSSSTSLLSLFSLFICKFHIEFLLTLVRPNFKTTQVTLRIKLFLLP